MFKLTHLHGFGTRIRQVDLSYTGAASSTTDASSYSFASVSLGAEADDRLIVIGVMAIAEPALSRTISGVTIAGSAGTLLTSATSNGGANSNACELWMRRVPTGTTGTILVSMSGLFSRCAIAAWRLTGAGFSAFHTSFDNSAASNAFSTTINIPSGGVAVAMCQSSLTAGTANVSWNAGVSEQVDSTLEVATSGYAAAHIATNGGYLAKTVTATSAGTMTEGGLTVASFTPR